MPLRGSAQNMEQLVKCLWCENRNENNSEVKNLSLRYFLRFALPLLLHNALGRTREFLRGDSGQPIRRSLRYGIGKTLLAMTEVRKIALNLPQ